MTLSAASDSTPICGVQLRGDGRWVRVALSLNNLAPTNQFLVGAEILRYQVTGADDAARAFGLFTWQGAVISGARYTFRALKSPIQQVRLHELSGELSSGDVWAVSCAAALAVARLLGRPAALPFDLRGWIMEDTHGAPSALPPKHAEDRAPALDNASAKASTQDVSGGPALVTDQPSK